jgi:hypothetical protein
MTVSTDKERFAELNARVTSIGNRTVATLDGPGRQQDLSDRALGMLALNNEILAAKGTRNTP